MDYETAEVRHLKNSLVGYYSTLNDAMPRIESIERDAISVIDKLHDHLEQLAICQRVEVGKVSWPPEIDPVRTKSQVLDKISSKCFFFVQHLKGLKKMFDSVVIEKLSDFCRDINLNDFENVRTFEIATVEHIPLRTLVNRMIMIDVAFKVRSDKISDALNKISMLQTGSKPVDNSLYISAEKIENVFNFEGFNNVEHRKTISSIISDYRIDQSDIFSDISTSHCIAKLSTNFAADDNDDDIEKSSADKVKEMLDAAFTMSDDDKKSIKYFVSQTEMFRLESSKTPNLLSTPVTPKTPATIKTISTPTTSETSSTTKSSKKKNK